MSAGVNSCAVVTLVAAIAIAAPKRLCAVQCSAVQRSNAGSEWAVLTDTFDYGYAAGNRILHGSHSLAVLCETDYSKAVQRNRKERNTLGCCRMCTVWQCGTAAARAVRQCGHSVKRTRSKRLLGLKNVRITGRYTTAMRPQRSAQLTRKCESNRSSALAELPCGTALPTRRRARSEPH